MPLFSYTTLNPTTSTTVTVDSGKPTLDEAFRDITAYCESNGYPLPSTAQIIDHEKPTPGPWDCDGRTTMYATPDAADEITMIEIRANVTDEGWDTVAFIEAIWPGAAANARLIASAQDLLKALQASQRLLNCLPRTKQTDDWLAENGGFTVSKNNRDAIDKATGKAA